MYPSLWRIPILSGAPAAARPCLSTRPSTSCSTSDLQGSGITSGSRNHGLVERRADMTSFKDPMDVPMTPIAAGAFNCPGFVFAARLKERRLWVGLSEYVPQKAAGILTLPATSLPSPTELPLMACSAASPPEDPPHESPCTTGLGVWPMMLLMVSDHISVWGRLVLQ